MKVKILVNCMAGGGPRKAGDSCEVDDITARMLINSKLASADDSPEAPKPKRKRKAKADAAEDSANSD